MGNEILLLAEQTDHSIDLLIADIRAHQDNLKKHQAASVMSILYPEVEGEE